MFTPDQYELLDFGGGRKLERFGPWVLDRPSPPAEPARVRSPELWAEADARFERAEGQQGQWIATADRPLPESWTIRHDRFVLIGGEHGQGYPKREWEAFRANLFVPPLE